MTGLLDRPVPGMDHVLPFGQVGKLREILGERLACDCEAVSVKRTVRKEISKDGWRAADLVQILHHVLSARLQVREKRHTIADGLKVVDRQRNIDRAGHRNQVQNRVGRAAERHDRHHGVFKGLARHDVARLDVLFQQELDRLSRTQAFLLLLRVFRGGRGAVGQRHAHRLDRRCHGVGGVHATASARAGAGVLDDVEPLALVDRVREELSIRLKRGDHV